jgi:hypothetical protein
MLSASSKNNAIQLLFNFDSGVLAWGDPALDVTTQVIAQVGKEAAPAKDASPAKRRDAPRPSSRAANPRSGMWVKGRQWLARKIGRSPGPQLYRGACGQCHGDIRTYRSVRATRKPTLSRIWFGK